jgi:hypothetical protein
MRLRRWVVIVLVGPLRGVILNFDHREAAPANRLTINY